MSKRSTELASLVDTASTVKYFFEHYLVLSLRFLRFTVANTIKMAYYRNIYTTNAKQARRNLLFKDNKLM